MNQGLKIALDAEGLPYTSDFYGAGTHTWPYWKRDLERFLAWLDPQVGQPVEAPAAFDLRSAREEFSAWGWQFRPRRDTREFAYLDDVSADGLTATGSGTLDVDHSSARHGPLATLTRRPRPEPLRRSSSVFGDDETARLDHEAGGDQAVLVRRGSSLSPCWRPLPGAAAAAPAPLSADTSQPSLDSTYGSGNFGHWGVDADGLPTFSYELDHMTDPRGAIPETPNRRRAQHQLGNDNVVAMAWNDGYTMLWSQSRLMQFVNTWEADNFHWAGGYGYLRTDDGKVLSTLYLDRPQGSEFDRVFGTGYYAQAHALRRASRCARTPTRRSATTRCCSTRCSSRT